MYQVFECPADKTEKPADYKNFPVDHSWKRNWFETFEEAKWYTKLWIDQNPELHLNQPFYYNGFDYVVIREVPPIKETKVHYCPFTTDQPYVLIVTDHEGSFAYSTNHPEIGATQIKKWWHERFGVIPTVNVSTLMSPTYTY